LPRCAFESLLVLQRRRYAPALSFCRAQLAGTGDVALRAIEAEIERQATINLVASESMPSLSVMAASAHPGYIQTIEGPVGGRWYPAAEAIDELEQTGTSQARALFGFLGGNLQPHSATQANQAVYFSSLKRDDTILAAAFTSGAHLSHGARASLARALYNVEHYRVPSFDGSLTLEHLEERIKQTRPSLIIAGGSAYPREIPYREIAELAKANGALLLADISHTAGLVAAGVHGPVHAADFCTFSTHKTLCGPRAGVILCRADYQGRIDEAVFPMTQGALFPNMIAAKVVCLAHASTNEFKQLQSIIVQNARALADVFADEKISMFTGGTDSHVLLIRMDPYRDARPDVSRLERIGILTNANYCHGDALREKRMTGIRLGTTWITQLGFQPRHVVTLGRILVEALRDSAGPEHEHRRSLERLLEDVLGSCAFGSNR
jgi:glycine hydroxymethyltransferase